MTTALDDILGSTTDLLDRIQGELDQLLDHAPDDRDRSPEADAIRLAIVRRREWVAAFAEMSR